MTAKHKSKPSGKHHGHHYIDTKKNIGHATNLYEWTVHRALGLRENPDSEGRPMTYEEVADQYKLKGTTRYNFIEYMSTRWPGEYAPRNTIIKQEGGIVNLELSPQEVSGPGKLTDENIKVMSGYAGEWANRFSKGDGYEYGHSDKEGRKILLAIAPGYYSKFSREYEDGLA